MSENLPPDLPVPSPAPQAFPPAPALRPRPFVRPDVPVFASCLSVAVGFGIALCAAGAAIAVVAARSAGPQLAEGRRRRAEATQTEGRAASAKSLLDAMAARITAVARSEGELPEMLAETAPRDPWGQPIQYERAGPDHAILASAGPDMKLGTRDDIRREIVLK